MSPYTQEVVTYKRTAWWYVLAVSGIAVALLAVSLIAHGVSALGSARNPSVGRAPLSMRGTGNAPTHGRPEASSTEPLSGSQPSRPEGEKARHAAKNRTKEAKPPSSSALVDLPTEETTEPPKAARPSASSALEDLEEQ